MVVSVLPRLDTLHGPPAASREPVLTLRLIGHMQALSRAGGSVLPPGRKTKALLAIVALSAPQPVERMRVAQLLWSQRTEAQARASVRQELHRLCETLAPLAEPVLRVTRGQLALCLDRVALDVAQLSEENFKVGRLPPWPTGILLEGFDGADPAFDVWLTRKRERFNDRLRAIAETGLRGETRPEVLVELAERLLALDRTHEGAWRALMRSYALRGERGLAIRAYERCREALATGVGALPSLETERTLAEIRRPHGISALGTSPRFSLPRLGVSRIVSLGGVAPDLARAITDEVTGALAHCSSFSVAASAMPDPLGSEKRDETVARRGYEGDFLLAGTLQSVADGLRLFLRLLDLREGSRVVWTRRFDQRDSDPIALQETAAALAAAELDVAVLLSEAERSSHWPLAQASAPTLTNRALLLMLRLDADPFARAGALFARAVAYAPDYAPAYAWYAVWHSLSVSQYRAADAEEAAARAIQLADHALALSPEDGRVLAIGGLVRDALEHAPHRAFPLLEKALAINPNLALASALSGLAYVDAGEFDAAERHLSRYKTLTPLHPFAFFLDAGFLLDALLRGDPAHAVALGRHASEIHPKSAALLIPYLAALGHIGWQDEAAGVRRRLLAIAPNFSLRRFRSVTALTREGDRERLVAGLRLAGIAEVTSGASC